MGKKEQEMSLDLDDILHINSTKGRQKEWLRLKDVPAFS